MDKIVVLTMAGTNLLTVVSPLEGSIQRQATILSMATLRLVQDYLAAMSRLQEVGSEPLDIPLDEATIYTNKTIPRLIAYCEGDHLHDVYLLEDITDNKGKVHDVPITIQHRPVFNHRLPE